MDQGTKQWLALGWSSLFIVTLLYQLAMWSKKKKNRQKFTRIVVALLIALAGISIYAFMKAISL